MAVIRQDLKLEEDPTTIVHPNIETGNIPDSGITTNKIADNAVTSAKLNDNAVTTGKIHSSAVTSGKIAGNAITTSKINDGAVTTDKLADGNVTGAKIATGTITKSKIAYHEIYGDAISWYDGLVFDFDTGDDFEDFLDWLSDRIKDGCTFYFDDEGGNQSQCLVARDGHEFKISNPLPLQGYATSYTINSGNEAAFWAGVGGTLHMKGIYQGV